MSTIEFESIFSNAIERLVFSNEAPLFYEGQYLSGLFFVKQGQIKMLKRKKLQNILTENQIIGLGEMGFKKKLKQTAFALRGTELLFVSRVEVLKRFPYLA